MEHAKTFTMASLPADDEELGEEAVGDQQSAVSNGGQDAEFDLSADDCPLTPDAFFSPQPQSQGLFDAMHDPVRRELLLAISTAEGGRTCPVMLCQRLGIRLKRVSHHLRELRLRDLVIDRQEAQYVWYTTNPARVRYETRNDRYALTITSGEYEVEYRGPVKALPVGQAFVPPDRVAPTGLAV